MMEMGLCNELQETTASLYTPARARLDALASQNRQSSTKNTAPVTFTI